MCVWSRNCDSPAYIYPSKYENNPLLYLEGGCRTSIHASNRKGILWFVFLNFFCAIVGTCCDSPPDFMRKSLHEKKEVFEQEVMEWQWSPLLCLGCFLLPSPNVGTELTLSSKVVSLWAFQDRTFAVTCKDNASLRSAVAASMARSLLPCCHKNTRAVSALSQF